MPWHADLFEHGIDTSRRLAASSVRRRLAWRRPSIMHLPMNRNTRATHGFLRRVFAAPMAVRMAPASWAPPRTTSS
jgi:hypothetical protein